MSGAPPTLSPPRHEALAELRQAVEHLHASAEALDRAVIALGAARAQSGTWATGRSLETRAGQLREQLRLIGRLLETLKRQAEAAGTEEP